MRDVLRKFFAPPVFLEDDERTRSAAILNIIGWSTIFILVIIIVTRLIQGQDPNLVEVNWALILIIVGIVLMLFLSHQGYVRAASLLLVTIAWIGLSYVAWAADGIRDVAFFGYSIPILMAGLLLGWREAVIFTVATILSGWVLAYAETNQLFAPTLDTPLHFARDITGVFALIGMLIYLTISSLQNALHKSQTVAQELLSSALKNEHLNLGSAQHNSKQFQALHERLHQYRIWKHFFQR